MDEGIYIVVLAGLVLVKRLTVRRDGSLILKSDNGRYEEERIPKEELADLSIRARVMWFGRAI
jgi:phage repressor protein C with HTH and peptisase S24 domain